MLSEAEKALVRRAETVHFKSRADGDAVRAQQRWSHTLSVQLYQMVVSTSLGIGLFWSEATFLRDITLHQEYMA